MARLLIFNPEHEYALAHGGAYYIAPLSIRNLARSLDLMPLIWATQDDVILRADNSGMLWDSKVTIPIAEIGKASFQSIEPWGWNPALKNRLVSIGINNELLPSEETLEKIRLLSHRRLAVKCNKFLNSTILPIEFDNVSEAMEFAETNPGCYFKLPWSGGGRGVLSTRELTPQQIKEWVTGGIKKQGSVIGERGLDRALDFASLWEIQSGEVIFCGFSVSLSDGRGKYDGNIVAPQAEIYAYILKKTPFFKRDDLLELQSNFIKREIAPFYEGKLGIDMIGSKDGILHPCVEINLRRTMGHVAMDYSLIKNPKKHLLSTLSLPLVSFRDKLRPHSIINVKSERPIFDEIQQVKEGVK